MGECSEFNGYTDYFTCMLLTCNGCYLMDKVFDKRKFVHMLMHLAKAGPCQLMFAETLHVASPGVFGKRPSVFSSG